MVNAWAIDLAKDLEWLDAQSSRIQWPSDRFEEDIERFCSDVIGKELWDNTGPSQKKWVVAATMAMARVSVASCHKSGKTFGEAVIALWAWATFDQVRVFLFAPKIEHIETVLWPEIKALYLNSGRCKKCRAKEHAKCSHDAGIWKCRPVDPCAWCSPLGSPSLLNDDPTKGLRSADGRREIVAYTARSLDALGGLSGPRLFFIFDEAGGVAQEFFDAMKGNSAGGATRILAGNPLHLSGEQYDAHHTKKGSYTLSMNISAEDCPNVKLGYRAIPGLATKEWMQECADDWGIESSLYLIRVLGQFPKWEPGALLTLQQIEQAFSSWKDKPLVGKRLQLGVDVATTGGDQAVIAVRRGYKIAEVKEIATCTAEELADACFAIGQTYQKDHPNEQKPLLCFDALGKEGRDFKDAIKVYEDFFDIVPINGAGPPRDKTRFLMRRDEIAHEFADFVKRGLALPSNAKLEGELAKLVAIDVSKTDTRKRTPTNDETRKQLGRSPDRRNGCELACVQAGRGEGEGKPVGKPGVGSPSDRGGARPMPRIDEELDAYDPQTDADRAARLAYGR